MFVCFPQVRSDRDKFTVYLDAKHFSPDELSVKITDDYVEIQGKHGERQVVLAFSHTHKTEVILFHKVQYKNLKHFQKIFFRKVKRGEC